MKGGVRRDIEMRDARCERHDIYADVYLNFTSRLAHSLRFNRARFNWVRVDGEIGTSAKEQTQTH